jgi:hypothetical protein
MDQERTEIPPAPTDVASPPPLGFTIVLWLGAFFTIAWGFQVLFARRDRPPREEPPAEGEDVTLEEPGPDRS